MLELYQLTSDKTVLQQNSMATRDLHCTFCFGQQEEIKF